MFTTNHVHEEVVAMTQHLLKNNWNWDFIEFCRCKLDQKSDYAKKQWKAFNDLTEAFHAIDGDILAVIGSEPKP